MRAVRVTRLAAAWTRAGSRLDAHHHFLGGCYRLALSTVHSRRFSGTKRETLAERNTRLREASEAKLETSRQKLMDDASQRNEDLGALREVMREKTVTLHPPPDALYGQSSAFRFPDFQATSLANETVQLSPAGLFGGQWTLLGCAGSKFTQPMVDGWVNGVMNALEAESAPVVQPAWLSLVDGTILSWLRWPLVATMRMSVPREQHASYLCRFGDAADMRRRMHMHNRYLGFVCLVDGQGVVRWHVHGNVVPDEAAVGKLAQLIKKDVANRK